MWGSNNFKERLVILCYELAVDEVKKKEETNLGLNIKSRTIANYQNFFPTVLFSRQSMKSELAGLKTLASCCVLTSTCSGLLPTDCNLTGDIGMPTRMFSTSGRSEGLISGIF